MSGGHRLAVLIVFAAGVGLRLALFSGYGLGDDPGFFRCYHDILLTGTYGESRAYDFRFSFWIPVVAFLKLFGVNEAAWVGFVTLCSAANLGLIYLLARQDWEPTAALIAMALLAVFPLEVLSSTLFVIDVPLATYCFAALWLYREALARARRGRTAWTWAAAAALFLFLGYSAKQWAVLVGVLFAAEALRDVRRTWRQSLVCGGGFLLLVGVYFAWQWVRFGDPIYDIHLVRSIAIFAPHSREIVLDYPRMLFLPNEYGTFFAGLYPWAVLALAVVFLRRLPQAGRWLAYTTLLLVALAAAPSHRENGQWVVLVPHIFRYLCLLSIPLCLALAAYLRELIRWRRTLGVAVTAALLVLTVWQGVALTAPTRDAFGEMRRANAALRAFPDERVASDYDFLGRFVAFEAGGRWDRATWLRAESAATRAAQFGRLRDAVVVTGGARLPWYGCPRCIADLGASAPLPGWTLVATFAGQPTTAYRHEPLRIWRASRAAAEAHRLLGERADADAQRALLRALLDAQRSRIAAEAGRLMIQGGDTSVETVYLAGVACARAGKPACATERLAGALERQLDEPRAREALTLLATASAQQRRYDRARAWAAELRRRFPDSPPGPEIEDIESGMAEGVASLRDGRLEVARRRFAALVERRDLDPARQRQARFYLALTLFRMNRADEARPQVDAYRAAYGEDAQWVELLFREAEALRFIDPGRAHALYATLIEQHAGTPWASEAERRLAAAGREE